jgi:hypothetical protein
VITVIFGPVMAAFAFVAAAFTVIVVLMGIQIAHAIDAWRLDHPMTFHVLQRRVK